MEDPGHAITARLNNPKTRNNRPTVATVGAPGLWDWPIAVSQTAARRVSDGLLVEDGR